ncbi:MAG: IS200/IS605 family transposase [Planctomycetia bacterium]|nr:IS200/IS605 family transposase [Planctomycetia bacterium]
MAHSYVSSLYHVVFSTKDRERTLTADLRERLWPYLGGIARKNRMKALVVGGVEDHVHLLLSTPSTLDIAKAVQLVKGASSTWIHEEFPEYQHVYWREGYGAFSIGVSQVDDTVRYIEQQEEHHRQATFQDEFRAFLKRHGFECDERYVWG